MKWFNICCLSLWMGLFALSLRPTPTEPENLLDSATYVFNDGVNRICEYCAYPRAPYAESNGTTIEDIPETDSRMTETILVNTFWFNVFTILALNFAFYCGSGAIGNSFDLGQQYGKRVYTQWRYRRTTRATTE
jgi:hypothetical protein